MELWSAGLGFLGALLQAGALVWAYVAVYRAWRTQWPDDVLSPRLTKIAARVKQLFTGRKVVSVSGTATAHATASAIGYAVGRTPDPTWASRLDALESNLTELQKTVGNLVDKTTTEIARLDETDVQMQADQERKERASVRSALTGAAVLALTGAAAQAVGAALAWFVAITPES